MWIVKAAGRLLLVTPIMFAIYGAIVWTWMKWLEPGPLAFLWASLLLAFGPLMARCVVWLDDWAFGHDEENPGKEAAP
jgi:hypothetical protein